MEKIIHKIINEFAEGVDTYTHNGGTWLIFTESKRWVVELTKDKILWYNYGFFKEVFSYASMDVVENQHYITKWVEDNIINGVRYTEIGWHQYYNIDDAIERGVKKTKRAIMKTDWSVEDTLENGVKRTQDNPFSMITNVENTIQNGVIKNGVRITLESDWDVPTDVIDGVLENGIKETELHKGIRPLSVEDTILNGVKLTNKSLQINGSCIIEEVIKEGTKNPTV